MPVPLVLAGAALNTAGTILNDIPVVGGLINQHPQDPARLAYDKTLYDAALTGDQLALHRLGVLGGILPPDAGGGIAATVTQKDDAAAKYNALIRGGVDQPSRAGATTPGGTPALSMLGLGGSGSAMPILVILAGVVLLLVVLRNRG